MRLNQWRVCGSAAVLASLLASGQAFGQFGTPGSTNVRERLTGNLLSAEGAPTVASGDQLGAFFNDQIVGLASFTSGNGFSIVIYGDNPATTAVVEGPRAGQAVQFRFFDASANQTRTDLRVENLEGEAFNYRYGGEEITIPDGIPIPIDLTPTRNLNIRLGVSSGGGGGGGGDDDPKAKYDVDGNDRVDSADAAMILRIVTGVSRGISDEVRERADVTGDNRIDTSDAIEVMQNR